MYTKVFSFWKTVVTDALLALRAACDRKHEASFVGYFKDSPLLCWSASLRQALSRYHLLLRWYH